MKRGKFIVIEGGLGCGKTTQVGLLKKNLKNNWVYCREPGGTPFGEKVRDAVQGLNGYRVDEYAAMFGYSASRANLIRGMIIPLLKKGKNVILDRYWYSSYAYQSIGNVSKKDIVSVNKIATNNLKPDLVLHYDLDPLIAIQRKKDKGDVDRYDLKKINFHKKVRKNYRELAKMFSGIWFTLDAEKSIQEVHDDTIELLKKKKIIK